MAWPQIWHLGTWCNCAHNRVGKKRCIQLIPAWLLVTQDPSIPVAHSVLCQAALAAATGSRRSGRESATQVALVWWGIWYTNWHLSILPLIVIDRWKIMLIICLSHHDQMIWKWIQIPWILLIDYIIYYIYIYYIYIIYIILYYIYYIILYIYIASQKWQHSMAFLRPNLDPVRLWQRRLAFQLRLSLPSVIEQTLPGVIFQKQTVYLPGTGYRICRHAAAGWLMSLLFKSWWLKLVQHQVNPQTQVG